MIDTDQVRQEFTRSVNGDTQPPSAARTQVLLQCAILDELRTIRLALTNPMVTVDPPKLDVAPTDRPSCEHIWENNFLDPRRSIFCAKCGLTK